MCIYDTNIGGIKYIIVSVYTLGESRYLIDVRDWLILAHINIYIRMILITTLRLDWGNTGYQLRTILIYNLTHYL